MHETMVAQSLIEKIEAEAAKQKAKPVSAKMSCGVFDALNDEAMQLAMEAIGKGTVCEGMKLEIEHKPIKAECKKCQNIFDYDLVKASCPACGGDRLTLQPDVGLILEEIEFEKE